MLVTQAGDINPQLLSKSNKTWNELRLNHPWSVGFTSELIRNYDFSSYTAWRHHYLESGVIRDKRLEELSSEERLLLNDHDWYHKADEEKKKALTSVLVNLNFHRGRSPLSIHQKAKVFVPALKVEGLDITQDQAAKLIGHRILIESWNGHVRETNTINKLESRYPTLIFQATEGWDDFKYAIDFTIEDDDGLIGALQIKPESYQRKKSYIDIAKNVNLKKNNRYKLETGVPVWTIISSTDGDVIHDDGLQLALQRLL